MPQYLRRDGFDGIDAWFGSMDFPISPVIIHDLHYLGYIINIYILDIYMDIWIYGIVYPYNHQPTKHAIEASSMEICPSVRHWTLCHKNACNGTELQGSNAWHHVAGSAKRTVARTDACGDFARSFRSD